MNWDSVKAGNRGGVTWNQESKAKVKVPTLFSRSARKEEWGTRRVFFFHNFHFLLAELDG